MLVLSRKTNERVLIGNDIEVIMLGIRGNEARLGILAPKSIAILRGELPRFDQPEAHLPLEDA